MWAFQSTPRSDAPSQPSKEQQRRKMIFNATKSLVVKIVGYKIEHNQQAAENPCLDGLKAVVYLNGGFFYSDNEPLILTSAHALTSGATHFYAFFSDDTNFNARHPLELVKSGQARVHENTTNGSRTSQSSGARSIPCTHLDRHW
ncbi:hypothetical protein Vretimale_12195 [Volvox reticuliferus]|uniref:Uncharacterized protein n=1 Tax=Volvox reticuliferus TaxID=1737510 RepID=A0A8J4CZN5_9CHLO|nr:hypothetical protein Vretifemale_19724 [Volvox reticuliferus]GIM08105.1 hypothetical protein Vretimale_12195 [Volvox reticuliferus]